MAKKEAPKAKVETNVGDRPAIGRAPDQPVGGIAAEDLAVLQGDIDSRMKALLKDHKAMGARK